MMQMQKLPSQQKSDVKTEIEEQMTVDLSSNIYTMSVSAKTTTTTTTSSSQAKTLRSFDSRERDYTYDDAIEDYKTRVSKTSVTKLDLPKVDINKRRELFEKEENLNNNNNNSNNNLSTSAAAAKLGTEIVSIKDRISSLRSNLGTSAVSTTAASPPPKKLEVPVSTKLKDRLSSLHQQVASSPTSDEPKRIFDTPFKNVQEARNEFELKQQQQLSSINNNNNALQLPVKTSTDDNESLGSTDREDSGIHTTDVSCSVSQADEQQPTERIEEFHHVIQEKFKNINVSHRQPDVVKHANESEIAFTNNTTTTSLTQHHQNMEEQEEDEQNEEDEDINDGNDDESSSVSCSDEDQNQSVMVLSLDGGDNDTNKNSATAINSKSATQTSTSNTIKTSNNAMINFIQCNLIDDSRQQVDDEQVQMDNNYVYECIINQSATSEHHPMKSNGLEKSNSVDAALSLCSSSDGTSLMD